MNQLQPSREKWLQLSLVKLSIRDQLQLLKLRSMASQQNSLLVSIQSCSFPSLGVHFARKPSKFLKGTKFHSPYFLWIKHLVGMHSAPNLKNRVGKILFQTSTLEVSILVAMIKLYLRYQVASSRRCQIMPECLINYED